MQPLYVWSDFMIFIITYVIALTFTVVLFYPCFIAASRADKAMKINLSNVKSGG